MCKIVAENGRRIISCGYSGCPVCHVPGQTSFICKRNWISNCSRDRPKIRASALSADSSTQSALVGSRKGLLKQDYTICIVGTLFINRGDSTLPVQHIHIHENVLGINQVFFFFFWTCMNSVASWHTQVVQKKRQFLKYLVQNKQQHIQTCSFVLSFRWANQTSYH